MPRRRAAETAVKEAGPYDLAVAQARQTIHRVRGCGSYELCGCSSEPVDDLLVEIDGRWLFDVAAVYEEIFRKPVRS